MAKDRRRQSREDRLKRLVNRCCPIHGIDLLQIDGGEGRPTLFGCPRRDCWVVVKEVDEDAWIVVRGLNDEDFGVVRLKPVEPPFY